MAPQAPIADIYVRVSRKGARADDRFHSPEEQEQIARAYAESRGLRVGIVLPPDIDKSGGTVDRAGLRAGLERVRASQSQGFVVAWIDRFSRDAAQAYDLLRELEDAGGRIWAPEAPEDVSSPEGELQLGMFLLIAQYQRKRAKAGFDRAKERAISNGIPVTNRDAVGYRRNAERRYEPDPDVAPIIREVFERRAAGAGPTDLAEFLESHGVRTSQGSRTWSKPAVQTLVKSRTYLGELRSGRHVNPAAHEPIVDEPTWLAAQHPNPAPPRARKGGYLLAGVLRCKACGYSMQGTVSSRGKRIYRCVRRHAGGICPEPARIEAAVVEAAVVDALFERANLVHEKHVAAVDTTPLQEAFALAERRLSQVLSPASQDALGDAWPATVKARRVERDRAAEALGKARAQADTADVERRVELVRAWQDEVGLAALAQPSTEPVYFLDPELKRRLIAEVLPAVSVARDKTLDFDPDTSGLSRRGYRREPGLNPL